MAKGNIFVDTKQLNRVSIELKDLGKQMPGAVLSALNRTLDYSITQVGRIVPKAYSIKATEVKNSFKGGIKRPSKSNLNASITSKGHTLSMAHFPHSPETPIIARTLGVSHKKAIVKVKIKKSTGRVTLKSGFIASTGASSDAKVRYNVFHRIGKSRLPIAPIRTLSIPQMISSEGAAEKITEAAQAKLAERIDHEVKYRLDKATKNIKG